ncbi:MAG: phosphatidylinositol mannoside acyltransferase [Actinomycetota bacterium]
MSGRVRDRLAAAAYLAAEWLGMHLSEEATRRLGRAVAALLHRYAHDQRRVVTANLARVLGEPLSSPIVRAAVREAYRSYARYWFDTFHARVISPDAFLDRYRMVGEEHIEAAQKEGHGAVLALPHLGNWDLAGRYVAITGRRVTAVAEELPVRSVFELFLRHRRALGMNIVPLSDDRKVGEQLIRLLGENHCVALVADRDLKGTGVAVEMFGAEVRLPAGPALLSLTTGSPLLPCAPYDTPTGWMVEICPPLEIERTGTLRDDVSELTRRLAREFERMIAADPTQWHMFQPYFDEPVER